MKKITSKLVAIPKNKYLHFTSYYNRRRGRRKRLESHFNKH